MIQSTGGGFFVAIGLFGKGSFVFDAGDEDGVGGCAIAGVTADALALGIAKGDELSIGSIPADGVADALATGRSAFCDPRA
ncbi:MAG TPA: hypothetical protein PK156_48835, partial [Polyangium sp.]|nr:hypothetical protein [Polyangium sp.]